jgi:hypothetical protein
MGTKFTTPLAFAEKKQAVQATSISTKIGTGDCNSCNSVSRKVSARSIRTPSQLRPLVSATKSMSGSCVHCTGSLPPSRTPSRTAVHHCLREFAKFGHSVRMMAPKFVTPYRLSGKLGKNNAANATAVSEAVTRLHMRFVPVKSIEQQSLLFVHRARQG